LGRQYDINQVAPVPLSQNPYKAGEAIGANDCSTMTTPSGVAVTGQAAINLGIACGNDANPYRPYQGFRGMDFLQFGANSNYNSLQVSATRTIAPLTLSIAYTYSHSIDDSSEGAWATNYSYVNSYDLARARGNSSFDQRHMLNISYVYDLPFFRSTTGWANTMLGGWQWSGIASIQSGTAFNVTDSSYSDNAGVANAASPGTFVDIVGDPHSSPAPGCIVAAIGPQLFNPCAFAHPRGLTFGNAGRNILHNPRTTNFDMSLLKHFRITEATRLEFRAEAFNVFNHTEWNGVSNDITNSDFLHPTGAHRARTLQLGLKFMF
jgi:hypothetical protein